MNKENCSTGIRADCRCTHADFAGAVHTVLQSHGHEAAVETLSERAICASTNVAPTW